MSESVRERIVRIIREMRSNTTGRGCSPAEAAAFAAKAAEWVEKYQISEAELRAKDGAGTNDADIEVCQNVLKTGKKVFNPGMTQVVNALAQGMCCKLVLLHQGSEAVYCIVGSTLDADYVCQIATSVVPALQTMAMLEGREHGYEKSGLVKWSNQYLTGAALEILRRLEKDRKDRSEIKEMEHKLALASGKCTALACVTGETLALAKRKATEEVFKEMYPVTRRMTSRVAYDHTAHECGRRAGKEVGLNIAIE